VCILNVLGQRLVNTTCANDAQAIRELVERYGQGVGCCGTARRGEQCAPAVLTDIRTALGVPRTVPHSLLYPVQPIRNRQDAFPPRCYDALVLPILERTTVKRILWAIGLLACCGLSNGNLFAQEQRDTGLLPETAEIKALINRAEQALAANGSDTSAILSDPRYLAARGWPRFRELIKAHAKASSITIVTPQEPGKPLRVRMRLVEKDGSPAAGALVYFYHTDAKGVYGPNDARVPPIGSDNNYARLFGYATTGADGVIKIQTIRPASYPDSDNPQHIHLRITRRDNRSDGSEIWFDDDRLITPQARAEAARLRIVICPVTTDDKGHASIDAKIPLK
jgi:protocatechuate 3,4-dioxygenase beta subunit